MIYTFDREAESFETQIKAMEKNNHQAKLNKPETPIKMDLLQRHSIQESVQGGNHE